MALPTISDLARVTADSEIRYTQSGKAVTQTRLAFNKRKFNEQSQKWEDDKVFFIDGTTWEQTAERAAQELTKGTEVFVTGEIETQQWEKDGEKKSKPSLTIRRFKVIPKVDMPAGALAPSAPQGGGYSGQPQGDPWAGGGDPMDKPPF